MAEGEVARWFRSTVGEGIQRLVAIGLPGGPGLDAVKITAQAWADSLWGAPIQWDERADSARLLEAFRRAGRNFDRWPAPRQVLELIPPRPQPRALPGPELTAEQKRRNAERIRMMREAIREGMRSE